MGNSIPITTSQKLVVHPETLRKLSQALCEEGKEFYTKDAEVFVDESNKYPHLKATLNINPPGHFKFIPELTHAPDSLAALGELGYILFAQSSLSNLAPEIIPQLSLDEIIQVYLNVNGKWAYLKRVEGDYKSLAQRCVGQMSIYSVHPAPQGYFVDAKASFTGGVSEFCKHLYDCRFSVNFTTHNT